MLKWSRVASVLFVSSFLPKGELRQAVHSSGFLSWPLLNKTIAIYQLYEVQFRTVKDFTRKDIMRCFSADEGIFYALLGVTHNL